MSKKRRSNGNASGSRRHRKRGGTLHDQVRELMAAGSVEDEVAAHLRMDKNRLRRKHIFALKAGREIRQQEEAESTSLKLSAREEEMRAAYFAGFGTEWEMPDARNLLQNDRTLAEAQAAFAEWLAQERKRRVTDV